MHMEPSIAFLVADRGRARLLLRHGDGRYETFVSLAAPRPHRRLADTRGRVFAGPGPERSALGEPEPDREGEALARDAAAAVDAGLVGGAFGGLVLVAPARALAMLRKHLSPRANAAVRGQMAKDFTKLPEAELQRVLDSLVLRPLEAMK
jgi:protein required for attachment to host cells